jgi:Leucine-rich repeat (LRR) protein
MPVLGNLKRLLTLDLSKTQVNDQTARSLAHMTSLQKLYLDQTAITDRALTYFEDFKISGRTAC